MIGSIRPEMAAHPMAQAARETNAYCEKHGLDRSCQHYDLETADVAYLAEQRAYRVLYALRGINFNPTEVTVLPLTAREISLLPMLITAYMDGLVIGWRAREIKQEENGNTRSNTNTN